MVRRALLDGQWDAVVTYSRDEQKAAQVTEEFGSAKPFHAFLGDVRDRQRLAMAFRGVDTVIHAAALKRVDQGAYSPSELIKTNITGTMNVVEAAIHSGVKRVVVLSSDKSVAPINLYGASKQIAETYAVQANSYGMPSGTRIAAVRYGNVLGSRGSVLGLWRRQVAAGQPVTLTDSAMTRFIMTIHDAVDLVSHTLDAMVGGEVFVPVLPSAYMVDLAAAASPDGWPVTVTGLRPGGEKLAESLLNEEEPQRTLKYSSRYYLVYPTHHSWTATKPWFGDTVHPRLTYRSDSNDRWLDVAALRALIKLINGGDA